MSERHDMGPLWVSPPQRPESWDAYSFMAGARCKRCRKTFALELLLPGAVLSLIPADRRDEAVRLMSAFLEKRAEVSVVAATGEDDDPPCKARQ